MTTWKLAEFRGDGYDKGRSVAVQALWFAVLNVVFVKWWCPPRVRPIILRWFGAQVGSRVLIRHRVRVQWPWKLTVGSDVWIGEDAWFMNLEPITVGSNCCISQGARLVTGSHDRRSPSFEFDNGPITLDDGVWVAVGGTVLRGVTLATGTVVAANAVAFRSTKPDEVVR